MESPFGAAGRRDVQTHEKKAYARAPRWPTMERPVAAPLVTPRLPVEGGNRRPGNTINIERVNPTRIL
jgi:hypothetical protein